MMKTYEVTLSIRQTLTYTVEGETEDDAQSEAIDAFDCGEAADREVHNDVWVVFVKEVS